MKKALRKLSSLLLAMAMTASLLPMTATAVIADETDSETPVASSSSEAEAPKETEKTEAEAPKETENAEAEVLEETEKPAEEAPAESEPENKAEEPAETDITDPEQPEKIEVPAEEIPEEADMPDAEAPAGAEETAPESEDSKEAKYAPIEEKLIDNVTFKDGILTWDAVQGATQYDIKIDYDSTVTVKTNSFELGKEIDRLIRSNEYFKSYSSEYYVRITAYDKNGIYKANYEGYILYETDAEFKLGEIDGVYISSDGILTWNAYEGAKYYEVEVGYEYVQANNRSVNLNEVIDEFIRTDWIEKADDGNYEVKVFAYNDDWDCIAISDYSTYNHISQAVSIEYGNIKDAKISSDGILTWEAYEGADYYYVSLTSGWGKLTDKTSLEIGTVIDELIANGVLSKTGKYQISIEAYDSKERYLAGYYGKLAYESSASELDTGEINGAKVDPNTGILSWDKYEGATKYWITVDDYWVENAVTTTSINIHKEIDKMIKQYYLFNSSDDHYEITIMADNAYGNLIAECTLTTEYKSQAEYVGSTTIQNVVFDTNGTMTWDKCANATSYKVYVEDVISVVKTTSFNINSKINSLVASGTIYKSSPYSIYITAFDSDGVKIGYWRGSYYYKSSSTPVTIGTISNLKSTNGIMTWSKYKGATKYKVNVDAYDEFTDDYKEITLATTTSNSVYINDLITKQFNKSNLYSSYSGYDIVVYALNKSGKVIASEYYWYKYLEPNTLSVTGKTAKAKRRKKKTLSASKVFNFKDKGQGTLTYTKASGNKKISINKKTGKITVKKGLKKKTYKVTIKVNASGKSIYAATSRTVTVKIKVK